MSNYSKLYWLTRLDYLQGFFTTIAIMSLLAAFACAFILTLEDEWDGDYGKIKRRILKWALPFAVLFGLIACFIPSKDDAVFIIAGGKTMDFVESDSSINKLPAQTTKLITDYLQRQIEGAKK